MFGSLCETWYGSFEEGLHLARPSFSIPPGPGILEKDKEYRLLTGWEPAMRQAKEEMER